MFVLFCKSKSAHKLLVKFAKEIIKNQRYPSKLIRSEKANILTIIFSVAYSNSSRAI